MSSPERNFGPQPTIPGGGVPLLYVDSFWITVEPDGVTRIIFGVTDGLKTNYQSAIVIKTRYMRELVEKFMQFAGPAKSAAPDQAIPIIPPI